MLYFLDILLTVVHLAIIFFNLLGWIPGRTRKAHLISILATAASWFILGIWFGLGYCPFTDWQWQVKEQLGEKNLPPNFVEYMLERLSGKDFRYVFVNRLITVSFALASLASVYVNFIHPRKMRAYSKRSPASGS